MSSQRIINLTFLLCSSAVIAFFILASGQEPPAVITQPAPIARLTHDPGNALRPAWSPDNRLIAFESNRDGAFQIYVMNADGSNQRALTAGANENRRPVWTPDGKSILYDSSDGAHQDIWIVHLASGVRKQLTRVEGLADYAALSPDGKQLVFYLYKDMTLNLWTMRADGRDAKPLTHDFADGRRKEPTIASRQPAWSADSQWLAYTGGDGKSIWVMRRDGTDARAIIADEETNRLPWFLPDGCVAFITEYVPPRYGGAWTNAWAYDLKTGARTLLYDLMSMQEPVAWNADNSKLVFASPRAGRFDLYLIDLNAPGGLDALRGTSHQEGVGAK
ncbi:MAG: PD40 domain-containing protein [Chloroflexi bacterium]|nr:PD40 domain-containing protein [Chloroflexota bacterium]